MPAVLITADRSNEVRAAADLLDVPVINKPLKPAVLRSMMTRLRRMTPQRPSRLRHSGGSGESEPIFDSRMTAWVRLSTPSFCSTAETCALIVASETLSS